MVKVSSFAIVAVELRQTHINDAAEACHRGTLAQEVSIEFNG